jgi:hypothetical protein
MPKSSASVNFSARISPANSCNGSTSHSLFSAMSSQPSQSLSSRPVHSVASALQRRRVFAFEPHALSAWSTSLMKGGGSAMVCSFSFMPKQRPYRRSDGFMRLARCRRNRVRTRFLRAKFRRCKFKLPC